MKLKELLTGISVLECTADPELEIKEIFYDSRKVTPGSLFVAVSGFAADGNKFIPMAMDMVRRGVMFSFRLASCWRVEVVKGGAGWRFFSVRRMPVTTKGLVLMSSRMAFTCSSLASSAFFLPSPW